MIDSFYDRALGRMTRRELLNIAWKLGAAAIAQPIVSQPRPRAAALRTYPFSLGVASGDPLAGRRRAVDAAGAGAARGRRHADGNVEVGWEIAPIATFRTVDAEGQRHRAAGARAQRPRRGQRPRARPRVLVSLSRRQRGQPDRAHQDGAGRRGRGRSPALRGLRLQPLRDRATSPRSDASPTSSSTSSSTPATTSTRAAPTAARTRRWSASTTGDEIYTLVDYRNRYALYKSDPDLRAAHASAPVHRDLGRSRGRQRLRRRLRRERHAAGDLPAAPRRRVPGLLRDDAAAARRRCRPARHAAVSAAAVRQPDRSERARHAAVPIESGVQRHQRDRLRRGARSVADDARRPSRSSGSSTSWRGESARGPCIGQQVPTFARDMVAGEPGRRSSRWTSGTATPPSRQRLYARLQETKAPNPIVLSGDVHVHYGADLKLDFANPRSRDRRRGVHEHRRSPPAATARDVAATWEQIRPDNPHIKYHSARRGYIACTATPALMRADFKILDRVTVPDAPDRIGGSLVVEAGRAGRVAGVVADHAICRRRVLPNRSSPSLLPECDHRILTARASRRQPRGAGGDEEQHQDRRAERHGSVDRTPNNSRSANPSRDRDRDACHRADGDRPQALEQREPLELAVVCRRARCGRRTRGCAAQRSRPRRHRCRSPREPAPRARSRPSTAPSVADATTRPPPPPPSSSPSTPGTPRSTSATAPGMLPAIAFGSPAVRSRNVIAASPNSVERCASATYTSSDGGLVQSPCRAFAATPTIVIGA